jgi:hypothetical protein
MSCILRVISFSSSSGVLPQLRRKLHLFRLLARFWPPELKLCMLMLKLLERAKLRFEVPLLNLLSAFSAATASVEFEFPILMMQLKPTPRQSILNLVKRLIYNPFLVL